MPETTPTQARVVTRGRPSLIWLVPIIAALIGAWLAYDTLSKRGPLITITFDSAEGLVAGQSQVKFKDVTMGTVQTIALAPDLTHVIVTARMNPEADTLLTEKAQFWVVKPRFGAGSISGLETVLSGSYIALLPSTAQAADRRAFTGLEDPPVLQSDTPGHVFLLHADRLGAISAGSPIFYRGLTVGEVLGWDIKDMAQSVVIHAFIRAPFDQYVHVESHFWNASGVSLQLGAGGVKVQVESIRALLFGGIAFDTPVGSTTAVAEQNATFELFADKDAADAAGFTRRIRAVAYFPGSVEGLSKGAPVTLRGIQVGQVTDFHLEYDAATDNIRVPVEMLIEPDRISGSGTIEGRGALNNVGRMVDLGFRAQLVSTNLLTGQKGVSFAEVPNAAPAKVSLQNGVVVLPTAPDQFGSIIDSVNGLMTKISRLPFDQIAANLDDTLAGAKNLVGGPEMQKTLVALQTAMTSARDVLTTFNAGMQPTLKRLPDIAAGLQTSLNQANKLMVDVGQSYGENSKVYRNLDRLMVQLNDTAQAIRVLADVLARHPEALVRGLPDTGVTK